MAALLEVQYLKKNFKSHSGPENEAGGGECGSDQPGAVHRGGDPDIPGEPCPFCVDGRSAVPCAVHI